jgi:putative ABC transport system substrate-binding protein
MKRREFISLLGGAAAGPSLLWPMAVRAQQPAIPVVGLLSSLPASEQTLNLNALTQSLRESGYIDGQNITIEPRYAEGDYTRLQILTAELVGRHPAVIVAVAPPAALALKQATTTIPVVFSVGFDPVAAGLVASMNRPGGNATGIALVTAPLGQKRFEFLLELIPKARRIGMLVNPTSPDTEPDVIAMQAAARSYGKELTVFRASNGIELEKAFAFFLQEQVAGLLIGTDPFSLPIASSSPGSRRDIAFPRSIRSANIPERAA